MRKKITLTAPMLMLMGSMFYFSGCKKTVESLIPDTVCTICTETSSGTASPEFCGLEAAVVTYEAAQRTAGFTCTRQ